MQRHVNLFFTESTILPDDNGGMKKETPNQLNGDIIWHESYYD